MFEVMVEMRLILGPVGLELCGTQNLPGQQIWTATDIEVDQHRGTNSEIRSTINYLPS